LQVQFWNLYLHLCSQKACVHDRSERTLFYRLALGRLWLQSYNSKTLFIFVYSVSDRRFFPAKFNCHVRVYPRSALHETCLALNL
jgi:hypothetical protein